MIATVSVKGQTVIPEAIREMARIKAGDQLDVGYSGGLIVMRKRQALTPARVRSLLLGGRGLPEMTGKDETAVVAAVQRFRRFVMALGWLWVPNRLPTACRPNGFGLEVALPGLSAFFILHSAFCIRSWVALVGL
jgi:AbrB family looped-hinge helix DNA binding protein